ncbi:MAG: ACT domain-containing protein, partial [Clostridia bacterium]|nr:ACT domain-containing protein [Clostridia bacterium]
EDIADREDGWCAFRIIGTLDFSLIGILAPIADILAENKIGILALSTFNTDYVFIKAENKEKAVTVLTAAGYRFR